MRDHTLHAGQSSVSRTGAPPLRVHMHTHTQMRRNTVKISKFVFSTSVRVQLSGEDSRRESGKQKERQEHGREGVSEWGTTCFCPSFISQPAVDRGSLSMAVTHRHCQGRKNIRAYVFFFFFEIATW